MSENNICYLEKKYLDVMIEENVYVEKEINKHIRCAVPIYEEEVEIQNITDDDWLIYNQTSLLIMIFMVLRLKEKNFLIFLMFSIYSIFFMKFKEELIIK